MDYGTLRRIREIAAELDATVPEEEAGVAILSPRGLIEGHELCIIANRLGYMRLATEFLGQLWKKAMTTCRTGRSLSRPASAT